MKNVIIAIVAAMLFASGSAMAGGDHRILFEFGVGFGNSSGSVKDKNPDSKWCKHRNRGRMKMGAIRYQYDDVEIHFARWTGDNGGADVCDRDMNSVGVGYVLSTQDDGVSGRDTGYASWTPGLSYAWSSRDRDFTGKDASSTNWRQTGNFQVFNRLALGVNGNDGRGELALHRYGTFNPDHGENFVTIGLGLQDLDDSNHGNTGGGDDGDREITPPIINNIENNETNITIIDNSPRAEGVGEVTPVAPITEAPVIIPGT